MPDRSPSPPVTPSHSGHAPIGADRPAEEAGLDVWQTASKLRDVDKPRPIAPTSPLRTTHTTARRVAVIYLAVGLAWVWGADLLGIWIKMQPPSRLWTSLSGGSLFVFLSAALIYWLIHQLMRLDAPTTQFLRAIEDDGTDAVIIKDIAGNYVRFNKIAGTPHLQLASGPIHAEIETRISPPQHDSEIRRAKEKLQEWKVFARGVLDAVDSRLAVLLPSGEILAVNEAWRAFEGANPEPGVNYLEIVDADAQAGCKDAAIVATGLRKVLAGGNVPFTHEYACHTPTERRWFLLTAKRFDHANGWVLVSHSLITERKLAEERATAAHNAAEHSLAELHAERALLRTLIDEIPDLIFTKDTAERFVLCNRAMIRFIGATTEDEIVGKTVFDFFPPEQAEPFHMADLHVLAGETITDREEIVRDAIGVSRWQSVIKAPIRDHNGAVIGMIGFRRDIQKQKEREQALAAGENRLRLALAAACMGAWEWDLQTGEAHQSDECVAIMGTDVLKADHDTLARVVHPEDQEHVIKVIQHAVEQLSNFDVEFRIVRPDGEVRWVHDLGECHLDTDGNLLRISGVLQDVTERKEAQNRLHQSREMLRLVLDNIPQGVFWKDRDSRFLGCNRVAARALGLRHPDEVVGKLDIELPNVSTDEAARFVKKDRDIIDSGHAQRHYLETFVLPDGHTVWLDMNKVPMHDGNGRVMGVLATWEDITERRQAEAALRESEGRLRSVMGSVKDAILTIDERGTIRLVNSSTERIFGYSQSELIGQNVKILMPEPFHSGHDSYLANYMRTGHAKVIGIGREIEGLRKDGTRFPLDLVVTEFNLDGQRYFTGVVRDITARKRLEEQFRQSQKMEAVGRLAGGISHDFNNLLTVINGHGDLALMGLSIGHPLRESVVAMRDAGERASHLTKQLLAFSRQAIVEPKILNLNDVVAGSERLLRRLIGEHIRLTVVADATLPRIKADSGQMEQVVMNLAVNSRDAMMQGGRLTISTRTVYLDADAAQRYPDLEPGTYAQLTVADTGHGMSPEVRSRAFEPFFTTKGVGQGTGLGLAVVHGVVQQCDGWIGVESEVGVGTTFELLLPAADGEEVAKPTAPTGTEAIAAGHETIMLVEDEPAVRKIAQIALEVRGYRVLEAECGPEAIRLLSNYSGTIDLLVTDVVMPEMGGRQLVETLRAMRPDLRVLYMTGYTDDAILHQGVEVATDALIQKPFTPFSLARKVRDVLDGATV